MPGSPPPPPPVLPPSSVDAPAPLSSPLPGDALRPRGDRPRKSRLYCNNAIPTLALNMASFFYHGGSWRAVHSSSICCVIFFSAGECLFVFFGLCATTVVVGCLLSTFNDTCFATHSTMTRWTHATHATTPLLLSFRMFLWCFFCFFQQGHGRWQ